MAVVGSTVLIVIFGEVIPQSVCVRYGLAIGASLAHLVLLLMYLFAPVAYPTAKLLDYLLGEDHGTLYKKAGLKTLITLHKALGKQQAERLNQDEVTIIQSVLDLKDKTVGSIMTPMKYVFTLSRDAVLDEKTMDHILSAGYSRIPIHSPANPLDFEGMLLVKTLITYDPDDATPVKEFALATLPETKPDTSCLDILNYFQEGQSHMVLVSTDPTGSAGAVGVVTLEDVIEELIGEEIIDESDIFIDNTSRVRRKPVSPSQCSVEHPEVEARATRFSRGFSSFARNMRLRRAFSTGATAPSAARQLSRSANANANANANAHSHTAGGADLAKPPLQPLNNALNP
ncbi:cell agglutination protein Mam3, partial [Ascosphaera acerosa]